MTGSDVLASGVDLGSLVGDLVPVAIFGAGSFISSRRFERRYGTTPWRWPSLAWGLVGGLTLWIGIVLLVVARRRTRTLLVSVVGPTPSAAPPVGQTGMPGLQPGWYPAASDRSRYFDGRAWTAYTSDEPTGPSNYARLEIGGQRAFLLLWAGGFGIGWLAFFLNEILGSSHDKPPVLFALAWLGGVAVAVPAVLSKAVDRLEIDRATLTWRGLFRGGQLPLSQVQEVRRRGNYVQIQTAERNLSILPSDALRPFLAVLKRLAPGVSIDPTLLEARRWPRTVRIGSFSSSPPGRVSSVADVAATERVVRARQQWLPMPLALLLLVAGLAVVASVGALAIVRVSAYLNARPLPTSGTRSLHLAAGTYVVFERPTDERGVCYPRDDCEIATPREIFIAGPSRTVVATHSDVSADRITENDNEYPGLVEFTVTDAGRYRITTTGSRSGRMLFALSPGEEALAFAGWIAFGLIGLLAFIVGAVGLLVGWRRSRAESRSELAPFRLG